MACGQTGERRGDRVGRGADDHGRDRHRRPAATSSSRSSCAARSCALPNQDVKLARAGRRPRGRLRVAEGDAVRAGQIVAEIDPRPSRTSSARPAPRVAQATAAARERPAQPGAHRAALRAGDRRGQGSRGRPRAARGGGGRRSSRPQAALDTADRQLARAHVTSPIAGQVVKRFVSVGEQVDGTAAAAHRSRWRTSTGSRWPPTCRRSTSAASGWASAPTSSSDAYPSRTFDGRGDRDRARGRPAPPTPPWCASA